MKILLAEDEEMMQTMQAALLKKYGEVTVVSDGVEAVEKVVEIHSKNECYDLICLDYNMPNKSGLEALNSIRKLEKENQLKAAKIVMLTSRDDHTSMITSFKEACDAYIIKPLTKDNLEKNMVDLGLN